MSKQSRSLSDYIYRQSHKEEIEARQSVNELVKKGIFVRGECFLASQGDCHGRIEAHHYLGYGDYHPFCWVCSKHHHQITNASIKFKKQMEAKARKPE